MEMPLGTPVAHAAVPGFDSWLCPKWAVNQRMEDLSPSL